MQEATGGAAPDSVPLTPHETGVPLRALGNMQQLSGFALDKTITDSFHDIH